MKDKDYRPQINGEDLPELTDGKLIQIIYDKTGSYAETVRKYLKAKGIGYERDTKEKRMYHGVRAEILISPKIGFAGKEEYLVIQSDIDRSKSYQDKNIPAKNAPIKIWREERGMFSSTIVGNKFVRISVGNEMTFCQMINRKWDDAVVIGDEVEAEKNLKEWFGLVN